MEPLLVEPQDPGARDRIEIVEAPLSPGWRPPRLAKARTPGAEFRVGDIFALPFADDGFDVVTSFNGIWKGCEDALTEARRVLVPDGRMGLTFWGSYEHLGLIPHFLKVIELSSPTHGRPAWSRATRGALVLWKTCWPRLGSPLSSGERSTS